MAEPSERDRTDAWAVIASVMFKDGLAAATEKPQAVGDIRLTEAVAQALATARAEGAAAERERIAKWQPIETAPKHCPILLFCEDWGPNFEEIKVGEWIDDEWCIDSELNIRGEEDLQPTHWIPVPRPPHD